MTETPIYNEFSGDRKAPDLRTLLQRIAGGDQAAFTQFMGSQVENVYSHALGYLRSVPQAEELTQDIFLQFWKVREKLAQAEKPEDYLFIIARNMIFRHLRAKVTQLVELPPEEDALSELLQVPDRQAEYKDTYALLLKGIALLPEKRRKVFSMSRLEGLSHEEISARTGLHKVTIAQYIMLALDFLRRFMKEHGSDIAVLIFMILYFKYFFSGTT